MSSLTNSTRVMKKVVRRVSPLERGCLLTRYVAVGKECFGEEFYYELADASTREALAREDRRRNCLPPLMPSLAEIMLKLNEDDRQNFFNLLREAESVGQLGTILRGALKLAEEEAKKES